MDSKTVPKMNKFDRNILLRLERHICRLHQQLHDCENARFHRHFENNDQLQEMTEMTKRSIEMYERTIARKIDSGEMKISADENELNLQSVLGARDENEREESEFREIFGLFAKKDLDGLRERLSEIERETRLGRRLGAKAVDEKFEILFLLRKLGASVSEEEEQWLHENERDSDRDFIAIVDN